MDGEECLRTLEELQASDGVREEETMDLFCFSLQGDCETFCPEITDARQMTVFVSFECLEKRPSSSVHVQVSLNVNQNSSAHV